MDVNNRASAVSTAASFATRRMALVHLKGAGIESPRETLAAIYENLKPSEASYHREVKTFEKYYHEAHEIGAYLHAIGKVAGFDCNQFAKLYDAGLTRKGREKVIKSMSMSTSRVETKEAAIYMNTLRKTPPFNPSGRDDFLGRYVDTTAEEDNAAYGEAYRIAENCLLSKYDEGKK